MRYKIKKIKYVSVGIEYNEEKKEMKRARDLKSEE
jgi:hypothetical protein